MLDLRFRPNLINLDFMASSCAMSFKKPRIIYVYLICIYYFLRLFSFFKFYSYLRITISITKCNSSTADDVVDFFHPTRLIEEALHYLCMQLP
jgi:hypothetical protein